MLPNRCLQISVFPLVRCPMPSITCPACGRRLRVDDALPGDAIDCPACGHGFTLDGGSSRATRAQPPPVPISSPEPFSASQWWARLGTSGRIMMIAALVGLLSCLLPAWSVSFSSSVAVSSMLGGVQGSRSVLVGEHWKGILGLLGFIVVIVFCFILYGPQPVRSKALYWVPVGIGGGLVLFALLLLIEALRYSQSTAIAGVASVRVTPGIGTFIDLLAGAAVLCGAILKARQERLI